MKIRTFRAYGGCTLIAAVLLAAWAPGRALAADAVDFTQETLDNGLQVIYAPLRQAPVVHVRVLYHVGSRDERPDRRGFAHMFEHMMFRGSAHVAPEQHMRLVGMVGGSANAFTSFDQTVYVNTLPSSQLELALYLEADRMASFRVSDEIYGTERKVVTEEWRMKQNRPYGALWEDFAAAAFVRHPYRWTPIGDMADLRAAQAAELQEFFNRYYGPGNAILAIAGDIDLAVAKGLVRKYFAWMPRQDAPQRDIPAEPAQTEARLREVRYRVPLAKVMIGYAAAPYVSDDNYALSLLAEVLGGGRSGRLDRLLVYGPKPLCVDTGASNWVLEDAGMFILSATALAGRDPAEAEKALLAAVDEVREKGVTPEELEKAKTQARLGLIHERETAASIAGQVGEAALLGHDAGRVNQELAKINAVGVEAVKAAARRYLVAARSTTVRVVPDPAAAVAAENLGAGKPSDRPIPARPVKFPDGYPARPPVSDAPPNPEFQKGVESAIGPVRVIVMPDSRLPLVNWSLTMRRGSDSDPAGKAGLASLTAGLVRRGAGGLTFAQLNEDLESRGIRLEVNVGGDVTSLSGSCLSDQLEHAMQRSRTVLRDPTFPAEEFANLKEQVVNQLRLQEESPGSVAQDDLMAALYGPTPLGVHATPRSVAAITLDDIRACYRAAYGPNEAVLVISGDVTVERGQKLAAALLADWKPAAAAAVDYSVPAGPEKRTIIVVDRPDGKQSTVRLGIRAYDVRSDEKFAGSLANCILSAGIDSRLGRSVRAQKGLAYSVWGTFRPGRHDGTFVAGTDTTIPSTADAVESICKVIDEMSSAGVTDTELAEAKLRVTGSMVMGMQTVAQAAGYRLEGILNGYPVDYYDKYPARINQVGKDEVRQVVSKFVRPDRLVIVVVAPAAQVTKQLERLGDVKVVPMPGRRGQADPEAPAPAKSAVASKPVKVFILAGQSNMEGKAKVELLEYQIKQPVTRDLFKHLQKDGAWVERDDVWIKFFDRKGRLTVGYGSPKCIGTELEFGNVIGDHEAAQVLLIKVAWGGRSLYRDFRSPSAGLPPADVLEKTLEEMKKKKPDATLEDVKAPFGASYRAMLEEVRSTLANVKTLFPEYAGQGCEVAGFVWFQGWNDMINPVCTAEYAANMAHFIRDVRKDLNVPHLPFVIGQMGVGGLKDADANVRKFKEAQAAAADLPEFKGNVALVKTDVFWDEEADAVYKKGWREHIDEWKTVGSDYPFHYLGSAKTLCAIGKAFGEAMLGLGAEKK